MLNALKRWLSRAAPGAASWSDVAAWAEAGGHVFKRTRDGQGFAVEGHAGSVPWRLEWGPPHRYYIEGRELRLRAELELPGELQMLVLSRMLMAMLEQETFESFTDTVQTYEDDTAPEEIRWLVMFPKAEPAALGSARALVGAVAQLPATLSAWLAGPLADQLVRLAEQRVIAGDQPFTLLVQRGRVSVRAALLDPLPASLAAWVRVLEVALERLPAATRALEAAQREYADSRRGTL